MLSHEGRPPFHAGATRDADTKEIAGFLLTLKHRPVTPDPLYGNSSRKAAAVATTNTPSRRKSSSSTPNRSPPCSKMIASPSSLRMPHLSPMLAPPRSSHQATPPTPDVAGLGSEEWVLPGAWEALLEDESPLVKRQDRDLVPDCLYLAMSQMKACRLQSADRVGCYKTREIGFVGMSCLHCGGQPGFGRYYPNSVRSLAQTTTSQTILKHIGTKCRKTPPHVKQALAALQRHQAIREGFPTGRPRYGSRKIFFQRIWERLHGDAMRGALDAQEAAAPEQLCLVVPPRLCAASDTSSVASSSCGDSHLSSDDEIAHANARFVAAKRSRDYVASVAAKRPKFAHDHAASGHY
jgi:hypothetical protein